MAVPVSELQSVAPSAIIELFELQLDTVNHGVNDIYRFHAGTSLNANGALVWAGNTYTRFPVEADGFDYNGQGQLPRPKIRVSNIMGTITALLLSLPSGLERAKVTRIRTLARYIDAVNFPGSVNPYGTPDPTAAFPPEIYYIDRKAGESRALVEFELAAAFDLNGVRGPKRQCISSICQWKYRSAECGYTAAAYYDTNDQPVATLALDACGKRLSSCETRFDLYTRTGGSVTSGSNVLTLPSTLAILPGELVRGWGIPTGATVTAVTSGTTLQLSANATNNSSVTVNGTPSATGAFMTVTSSAGLSVGMTAEGPLMNGATITGISGTTITLSKRPYTLLKEGIYKAVVGDDYVEFASGTTGVIVGMYAFGPFALSKPVIVVESTRIRIDTVSSIKALYEEPLQIFGTIVDKKKSINNKPVTVYFITASPPTASYTFTGNSTYSFRDSGTVLPFGSFPGVGSYTS